MTRTYWITAEGKKIAIKDLVDTHLANVIHHMTKSPWSYNFTISDVNPFLREAKKRKLTKAFLERAPIPFKHKKDKKWKLYDYDAKKYKTVGR